MPLYVMPLMLGVGKMMECHCHRRLFHGGELGGFSYHCDLVPRQSGRFFSMDLVVNDANAESLREMLTPRGLKRMLKHTKKLATVRKKLV